MENKFSKVKSSILSIQIRLVALAVFAISIISCQTRSEVQFMQYYVQGQELYVTHCSNCHQKNGTGLGLLYPPLNTSDYMEANFNKVICLMKKGTDEELMVNGKKFNQPMPGVPALTELEIAEIATYIYNSWGHERGRVEIKDVSEALASCQE